MSDEGKIWKFRPPPRTIGGQDAYKLCPVLVEEGYCRFALQCTGKGLFLILQCLAFSNFFRGKQLLRTEIREIAPLKKQ